MKKALFPGAFDPFTIGHLSIVKRALPLFDEIIVGIGHNTHKKSFQPIEKRLAMIQKIFENEPKVKVQTYENLTVDFAEKIGANVILRGIRSITDFEYERTVADVNRRLSGIETILLFTETEHSFISSSIVRELLTHGKNISQYMPQNIDLKDYI